jgi:hypothetical protein
MAIAIKKSNAGKLRKGTQGQEGPRSHAAEDEELEEQENPTEG